ncbi:MAG TPA: Asd/ArgC dimerization domain-containing protein, partial [Candidatus Polarisedimenticolaceae bacterium]|nr:Asd/ArgC dimerization domain-containing protein [Candidatus Polarisedimenticolaceae bacterium]
MARRSAEKATGKIAVLGAASPAGARLRAALADRGVEGARVALYGAFSEVAVLSEYDGEARLVQPVGELDPASCAVVFVCEGGHDPAPLSRAASAGTVVVDLSASVRGATEVPHPIAGALAAILAPLEAALGLSRVSAVVLRPAADFGEPGMEELREQTVRLLRFEKTPTDVFGRQLAFNVVPDPLLPDEEAEGAGRIVSDTKTQLSRPDLPLTVTTALVPIFLGHAVSLHVDLDRGSAADASEALSSAPGVTVAGREDAGCTMDVVEDEGIVVTAPEDAGAGSIKIWAVVADAGRTAASRAVDAA